MTDKEYILRLLDRTFLDIRVASYEQDSRTCFILADIFHNVPSQIRLAEKNEMSYKDIILSIRERCERKNYVSWLEVATADITKWHQHNDLPTI